MRHVHIHVQIVKITLSRRSLIRNSLSCSSSQVGQSGLSVNGGDHEACTHTCTNSENHTFEEESH